MSTRSTLTRRSLIGGLATGAALMAAPSLVAATHRRGAFVGASNHVTRGTGGILIDGAERFVTLAEDFWFDGAPDPKVALGRDGYDPTTLLGPLRANEGAQRYAIPARIDASAYTEVWIWCERFNVPLGVARLT